jgi:hypothetical protein
VARSNKGARNKHASVCDVVDDPLPSFRPEGVTIAGSVRRGTASIAKRRSRCLGRGTLKQNPEYKHVCKEQHRNNEKRTNKAAANCRANACVEPGSCLFGGRVLPFHRAIIAAVLAGG